MITLQKRSWRTARRPGLIFRFSATVLTFVLAGTLAWAQDALANSTPKQSSQKTSGQQQKITPQQAKQLFALVDELIGFSSKETGLEIKSPVKRRLITRNEVESYLKQKFDEDQSAQRMQHDEILLKKFGLLDRDFQLKPFLLALLKEQIEAFYDTKTKTVNLLDWVDMDEQKPVMAHELTHALQDQYVDLEKWSDQTPDDVSTTALADLDHLNRDEMDTAREAVTEGQATAVMTDYMLKPMGKNLVNDPEVVELLQTQMGSDEDSPVMARAPLLLSESMLFPYREGLSFEQDVWMEKGQKAAFAGMLDHPPSSSWEILNPHEFEQHHAPAVPMLPDVHPLLDKTYAPYDIGQMGQLDVHILTKLLGGDKASQKLTPAWNGGLYWAGQLRSAKTPAEQASTASLAFFYLANWRNEATAQAFAQLYANNLARKYSSVKELPVDAQADPNGEEILFSTNEGPVLIVTRGTHVFIAESFSLELGRKLAELLIEAQATGETRMAQTGAQEEKSLTADLVHLFANCGMLKVVADAEQQTKTSVHESGK